MAGTQLDIPNFSFSGFFYPQILDALVLFKRANVPELTDESEFEPFQQMLRAVALVGHLNNVLIDLTANESTLPTAQLAETVRNMLRLIDYDLRPATPSGVDMVYKLARTFAATTEVISRGAQVATEKQGTTPVIFSEVIEPFSVDPTDRLSAAWTETPLGVFADFTSNANAGSDWIAMSPTEAGNKVYFGHTHAMFTTLALTVTAGTGSILGVWEYFDGNFGDNRPSDVTNIGGGALEFNLNSLLGTSKRSGAIVRITLNDTGVSEDVVSVWNGTVNIGTTTLLGQSSPSTSVDAYTIGAEWEEITPITDGTVGLTTSGDVVFDLPQDVDRNWTLASVNGIDAFYVRFRVIENIASTPLTLNLARIDTGDQFILAPAVQGRSIADDPLGSSSGAVNQRFDTSVEFFILNSQVVRVDNVIWTKVDNFLESTSQNEHYVVELGENDRATIVFGDGTTGKIPDVGQGNIRVDYRHGASDDGNVGPRTLIIDKTGLTFVQSLFNPRQAVGWAVAQSATQESLEKAKTEGPASLRTKLVAITPDDAAELAIAFLDSNGSSPFGRADGIEEGFGPKTMELVLVARGGGQATPTQLTALDLYFNGDKTATPIAPKRVVANQKVVSVNFVEKPIDIVATVTVPKDTLTAQQVKNQLSQILQPEALESDGVTFVWKFGAEVPRSKLIHEIHKTSDVLTKVVLTTPATDTQLEKRELPTAGSLAITIVET